MIWSDRPWWDHGRLKAIGSERVYRAPEVGELVVSGATQTYPGVPRRIVSVCEDTRGGYKVWIVEHTAVEGEPSTGVDRDSVGFWAHVGWPRLPEHYPICAVCQDLMPCQHVVIDHVATCSAETMERYSSPGVCPSCQEPVTGRQKAITFDRNLHSIGPVTFHLRRKCRHAAYEYDRDVHADDGGYQLTCPGSSRGGLDELGMPVIYCTESDCRGADRKHRNYESWVAAYLPRPDGYYRSPDGGVVDL